MAANEGMFRRDGGVKKKTGVDVDCVAPAWATVRDDAVATTFAIFTYAGKKAFRLVVQDDGTERHEPPAPALLSIDGSRAVPLAHAATAAI